MKKLLASNIIPFKGYWVNCVFNSYMSILIAINPLYKYFAFMNNYSYAFEHEKGPSGNEVEYFCLKSEAFELFNQLFMKETISEIGEDPVFALKEYLSNRENIMFWGVDLYYWVENSICWKKNHWYHYSLIIDYDMKDKAFIVLDDDVRGYDIRKIPEDRARIAFNSFIGEEYNNYGKGYILKPLYNRINSYILKYSEIVPNINGIIDSARKVIENKNLWNLNQYDLDNNWRLIDLFVIRANAIANRHRATTEFLRQLFVQNIINKDIYDYLSLGFTNLNKNWEIMKNQFIKWEIVKDQSLHNKFIFLKDELLFKEIKLWEVLQTNIDKQHLGYKLIKM